MKFLFFIFVSVVVVVTSFHRQVVVNVNINKIRKQPLMSLSIKDNNDNDNIFKHLPTCIGLGLILTTTCNVPEVLADSASYGVLAGRTASMLHPVSNFALFGTSLYSAYLGYQWRRQREIGEEIRTMNNELPTVSVGKVTAPVKETVDKLSEQIQSIQQQQNNDNNSLLQSLQRELTQVSSLQEKSDKIEELSKVRKSLVSANLKDKHFATGDGIVVVIIFVILYELLLYL